LVNAKLDQLLSGQKVTLNNHLMTCRNILTDMDPSLMIRCTTKLLIVWISLMIHNYLMLTILRGSIFKNIIKNIIRKNKNAMILLLLQIKTYML